MSTRACLVKRGLRALGGPVPASSDGSTGPGGELVVGTGASPVFIAFYADPGTAARLEPKLISSAAQTHGQVERRGAVTVVWMHGSPPALRGAVRACAFG